MPGLRGYSLVQEVETEIVSAYAAGSQSLASVASGEGWFVIGSFFLPKTVSARLEIIGSVSHASLTGQAKLIDTATGLGVTGTLLSFTNLNDERILSGKFDIAGAKAYSVVAQATGSAGIDRFFSVRTASLVGP